MYTHTCTHITYTLVCSHTCRYMHMNMLILTHIHLYTRAEQGYMKHLWSREERSISHLMKGLCPV